MWAIVNVLPLPGDAEQRHELLSVARPGATTSSIAGRLVALRDHVGLELEAAREPGAPWAARPARSGGSSERPGRTVRPPGP